MVVVMFEEPHALLVEGVSPSSAAAEHFVQNQVDRMALADLCFVTFLDFVSHARFRGSEDGVFGVVGDVGQAVGGAEGRFQRMTSSWPLAALWKTTSGSLGAVFAVLLPGWESSRV